MLPGAAAQHSTMMGAQFQKTTMTGEPRSAKPRHGTDLRLFMETLASAQRRAAEAHPSRPHATGSASCVGEQHAGTAWHCTNAALRSWENSQPSTFLLLRSPSVPLISLQAKTEAATAAGASGEPFVLQRMLADAEEFCCDFREVDGAMVATAKEAQALNTELAEALLAQRSCVGTLQP
ncbi:hypothetical protein T484DRAFT_1890276 [Baffinella frigidus]|nr:hypothetical protein T484DRAFT_1890276 [Cryptophyta sp. CCMP2293]